MHHLYAFPRAILLPLLAVAALPVLAVEPASNGPRFASRTELRACMSAEDAMNVRRKMLEKNLAENHAALKQIQDAAAVLVQEQGHLDTTDEKQVDAFNEKVGKHNRHREAANAQAESFKTEEDSYNSDMRAFNRRCATLVYRLIDREAVLTERKAAAK